MKLHMTRLGKLRYSDGACPRALCLRQVDAWRQTTDPAKVTCRDCLARMTTQFERALQQPHPIRCDICGGIMHPMPGWGWDHDRIVCAERDCGAEIEYPTSTPVEDDET